MPTSRAIWRLLAPSAARNTMRARAHRLLAARRRPHDAPQIGLLLLGEDDRDGGAGHGPTLSESRIEINTTFGTEH